MHMRWSWLALYDLRLMIFPGSKIARLGEGFSFWISNHLPFSEIWLGFFFIVWLLLRHYFLMYSVVWVVIHPETNLVVLYSAGVLRRKHQT
ncbi:hypothetical protein ASPBRDRAFT_567465 [Aspergillus brasiliensis CBS 101740]|uniref:Uncharacterized protein n=1 Tax=Aspergillus brasiliensis (strain CBS 101740 / IMI 381727 / IBT 21946) TaxID=767769 RepID=A0A1L9UIT5_ASPBC|nr:hypothetical protein ASPBRDRAFT_567465 [Aspergillus brasiliensis CBS 101740]